MLMHHSVGRSLLDRVGHLTSGRFLIPGPGLSGALTRAQPSFISTSTLAIMQAFSSCGRPDVDPSGTGAVRSQPTGARIFVYKSLQSIRFHANDHPDLRPEEPRPHGGLRGSRHGHRRHRGHVQTERGEGRPRGLHIRARLRDRPRQRRAPLPPCTQILRRPHRRPPPPGPPDVHRGDPPHQPQDHHAQPCGGRLQAAHPGRRGRPRRLQGPRRGLRRRPHDEDGRLGLDRGLDVHEGLRRGPRRAFLDLADRRQHGERAQRRRHDEVARGRCGRSLPHGGVAGRCARGHRCRG